MPRSLDLQKSSDEIDLREEAAKAEDFAIRYARHGSFALIYILVSYFIAGQVIHRFPLDERVVPWIAIFLISVPLSAGGVMLGELWSVYVEVQRVGMGHLSYRVDRIPWTKYREVLFGCGLMIFWLTAALRPTVPAATTSS